MERFISNEAQGRLIDNNADAALGSDPALPVSRLGSTALGLSSEARHQRRPSPTDLLQAANMIISSTRRERGIYFVR